MQRLDRLAREIRIANAETEAAIVATRRQIAALQAQAILLGQPLEKARAIARGDFDAWLSQHCQGVSLEVAKACLKVKPEAPARDALETLGVFDEAARR